MTTFQPPPLPLPPHPSVLPPPQDQSRKRKYSVVDKNLPQHKSPEKNVVLSKIQQCKDYSDPWEVMRLIWHKQLFFDITFIN